MFSEYRPGDILTVLRQCRQEFAGVDAFADGCVHVKAGEELEEVGHGLGDGPGWVYEAGVCVAVEVQGPRRR